MHAVTDCDTTSVPFRKEKKQALKVLQLNQELSQEMLVFNQPEASHEEIAKAGETFLLALYTGGNVQPHYLKYNQAIGRQSLKRSFDIATLSPTTATSSYHSFRTYLQVKAWMGRDLNPTDWGWKESKQLLLLVETAPDKILNIASCKCQKGCR